MFFLISGVNFFRDYTPEKAAAKLKRRVKSLLIPYLAWNTIYCAFALFTSNTPISQFFIGREKYPFSILNIISGCLYHWNCNGHFWFVFDLMLFALLSPLFYHLMRTKAGGLLTLLASYAAVFIFGMQLPVKVFYRTDAVFYYLVGAYIALHGTIRSVSEPDCDEQQPKHEWLCIMISLLLMSTTLPMGSRRFPYVLYPAVILLGCYGIWLLGGVIASHVSRVSSGAVIFFLYPAHGIIQPVLTKLIYLALPKMPWISGINFILSVTLSAWLCCAICRGMKQYSPGVERILTGWRK